MIFKIGTKVRYGDYFGEVTSVDYQEHFCIEAEFENPDVPERFIEKFDKLGKPSWDKFSGYGLQLAHENTVIFKDT